jgi:very-short-patch-repair endonuclease
MVSKSTKYSSADTIVCWLKSKSDLSILLTKGWYRIPISTKLDNLLKVKYLAFYQSHNFGKESLIIKHYGTIKDITTKKREELFPDEPKNARTGKRYYKIRMKDMNILDSPVYSRRARRVIFLNTTLNKLQNAKELNDLFHCSPLEDILWNEFKIHDINAERQYYFGTPKNYYCLDFAAFCKKGNLDIECDGEKYHSRFDKVVKDYKRDNFLTKKGWSILRYSTNQIIAETSYCIEEIKETILSKGGAA